MEMDRLWSFHGNHFGGGACESGSRWEVWEIAIQHRICRQN